MIHIGINLHTLNRVNAALNDNGELLQRANLPANKRALLELLGSFGEPVQVVVESTSSWYWLADWCQANDIPLTLAHAKMTKAISYAKVKTDKDRECPKGRRMGEFPVSFSPVSLPPLSLNQNLLKIGVDFRDVNRLCGIIVDGKLKFLIVSGDG